MNSTEKRRHAGACREARQNRQAEAYEAYHEMKWNKELVAVRAICYHYLLQIVTVSSKQLQPFESDCLVCPYCRGTRGF